MNVEELIYLLSKQDPKTRVVTAGYENGFEDVEHVRFGILFRRKNQEWWDGTYDEDNHWKAAPEEVVMIYGSYRK
ncbi:hypothetical protein [Pseudomonas fluorescens]|uniref:Uncharacterized protein n=1 Tax=Pseudomonas fluorescens TaxID=294 RepID=A0A0F4VEJ6_PSEFL|nr:hypothetical protein [Pseudomonas fluorescens]KJZ67238.1 hypothetical protein VD17_02955 [Pseudomonas fluorescens]